MKDRRMATPHYRKQAERDNLAAFMFTIALTFMAGCLCGATLAMGWLS